MKFWFHQVTLNYCSSMSHRLDAILACAKNHSYVPYAPTREGNFYDISHHRNISSQRSLKQSVL